MKTSFVLLLLSVATLGSPILDPPQVESSTDDAESLWNALQDDVVNTDTIIEVLSKHTNAERQAIIADFSTLHGEDLVADLKQALSGDFENLIVAMLTRLPLYYADELYNSMTGVGTDEDALVEILISLSNAELKAVDLVFTSTYEQSLVDAITDDTSGSFKDLLLLLASGERDETTSTDEDEAAADAETLSTSEDFETFADILSHRSYAQLELIFKAYESLVGDEIETTIDDNFSGDVGNAFLAIVAIAKNKPGYYAVRLNDSISGLGTSDSDLIRLIVTRSEIDIDDIKAEYETLYDTTLAEDITDDTSGDYQKGLLALIGE